MYGCVEVKSTTTECLNTATDNNTQPSNNEILITVTIENNEQLEKSHDDIDLNDLIAIQELSGGMFDHILGMYIFFICFQ